MKEIAIFKSIGSGLATAKFMLRRNSPEIWLVTGIVAGATCAVLTGIASTKVLDVVHSAQDDIDLIKAKAAEELEVNPTETNTPDEATREVAKVYIRTGLQLAKLYTPAAIAGVVAIGTTLLSHKIMNKRNVAVSAALLTVTEGFNEYRNRVKDRLGEEVERDIRDGVVEKAVERTVVDPITGKEKKIKEKIKIASDPNLASPYATYFDKSCYGWEHRQDYREMFLGAQQSYANDKLRAQKYLFLNDVYDMLGIEKTEAGQVVGWTYNLGNPVGDNYIDFRAHDVHIENVSKTGEVTYELVTVLDFNCEGNIWSTKPFTKAKKEYTK